MTVLPVASMTVAPAGTRTESAGPTAVIRSPSMTTVVRGRTIPFSLSKTLPFRTTRVFGAGGVRRRATAADFSARMRASIARSAGSTPDASRGTVMNHSAPLEKSPPESSSHTLLAPVARPSTKTRRTCRG
jgi:hypothetical protein